MRWRRLRREDAIRNSCVQAVEIVFRRRRYSTSQVTATRTVAVIRMQLIHNTWLVDTEKSKKNLDWICARSLPSLYPFYLNGNLPDRESRPWTAPA